MAALFETVLKLKSMYRRLPPKFNLSLVALLLLVAAISSFAQTKCLTTDEVKRISGQLDTNVSRPFNKNLSDDLIKLGAKQQQRLQDNVTDNKSSDTLIDTIRKSREKNTNDLCAIVKQYGWPTRDLVGDEGSRAAFFLLRNSSTSELQRDLLPVIIAAVKKGEITKAAFATYIDRLRLNAGLKQIFGTQATILNDFLVLFPITDETHVDARRKQYDLPPLREYLRGLEKLYRLPLIKSTGTLTNSFSDQSRISIARATDADLLSASSNDDVDVVRVETNLVSLNVSIYATKLRTEVAKTRAERFYDHRRWASAGDKFFCCD